MLLTEDMLFIAGIIEEAQLADLLSEAKELIKPGEKAEIAGAKFMVKVLGRLSKKGVADMVFDFLAAKSGKTAEQIRKQPLTDTLQLIKELLPTEVTGSIKETMRDFLSSGGPEQSLRT